MALALVPMKAALVDPLVVDGQLALTVHEVLSPLALVLAVYALLSGVDAIAMYLVLEEVPRVSTLILQNQHTFPMLPSLEILPLVETLIAKILSPLSVLLVILPKSLVHAFPILIIDALPMGFVIFSISRVEIPIGVRQLPMAVRHVIFPVAIVKGAVLPLLDAQAIAFFVHPEALIQRTIGYHDQW